MPALLPAWTFPRSATVPEMVAVALGGARPPDLALQLLSSTGDTITVQVVEGQPPVDPDELLYVGGRGAYELARREDWPGGRVLLTLAAWPRR